eukprot:SAG31_NODE_48191_length_198_cov_10.303030_1_plen_59_part_10
MLVRRDKISPNVVVQCICIVVSLGIRNRGRRVGWMGLKKMNSNEIAQNWLFSLREAPTH